MTSQFYPFPRFFTVLFAWLLISCSSEEPKTEEEPEMNVEAELIFFNYKNDLEEDTFVWEYEVQFLNHSDFTVKGVPLVTYRYSNSEDFTITPGFTSENNPCPTIAPGETCTLSFYQEGDLQSEIYGEPLEIIFVKAEYRGEPAE